MAKSSKENGKITGEDVEKVIEKADKGYVEPKTPEEKAFQKGSVEGHDPNKLENPHASAMTVSDAEQIVKKYEGGSFIEEPNELVRAKDVLRRYGQK